MKERPWLATPAKTAEILQRHGFRFQKKYGQNFLIDPHVPEKILRAAEISEEDMVLEIGPGIGTLTQYLAFAAKQVYAVEIDRTLLPILEETLSAWDNVTVISGDILKLDLRALIGEKAEGQRVRVAANLPYYITTPILMTLLEQRLPLASVTVMVQKEVAARMQAKPGTKEYGALSLAVQYYTEPETAAVVPRNCFIPRPEVDSAVVHLKCREERPAGVKDEGHLFKVIRAAFAQRRKTLVNALAGSPETAVNKEQASEAVRACGFAADIRGEKLSLEEFIRLAAEMEGYL